MDRTPYKKALYWALKRAATHRRGQGGTLIWTDSLYALNMTTGTWLPRKRRCRTLVRNLRSEWRELQRARPGEVKLRHVRSHVKIPGNELADWLAELRYATKTEAERHSSGDRRLLDNATRWLQTWLAAPAQYCGAIPHAGRAGDARRSVADTDRSPGSLGDATGEG